MSSSEMQCNNVSLHITTFTNFYFYCLLKLASVPLSQCIESAALNGQSSMWFLCEEDSTLTDGPESEMLPFQ